MRRAARAGVIALLFASCSSAPTRTTWSNPDANLTELTGKKVAVIVTDLSHDVRLGVEEVITGELEKTGANAVPASRFMTNDSTLESVKQQLHTAGFDAVFLVRVADRESKMAKTTALYMPQDAYGNFWSSQKKWGPTETPELQTQTNVSVETVVYSVTSDQMVWSALTVITNPSDVRRYATDLVDFATAEMKAAHTRKPAAQRR